jgi:uncharacterized membrane protein YfcA
MYVILAAMAIAAFAFFVRGFSGFGSALVMTPLLLLLFDLPTTVTISAMMSVVTGFTLAKRAWPDVDRRRLRVILTVGVPAILVGSQLLVRVDSKLLARVFGVVIVLFAARMLLALRGDRTRQRAWPDWSGYLAGAVSGFMGGAFGTSGPPILIYLENQVETRYALRATLLAYFFVVDGVRLATYFAVGVVRWQALLIGTLAIPAGIAGGYLGTHVHGKMNERTFRVVIAVMLLVTGLLLVVGR